MISDDIYVQKAIKGDDKAFDALVKRHRPRIYEVIYKMLRNPRDVERMTHATFSAGRKHIKTFRGRIEFGTWLHRIAVNQCLQYRDSKTQLGIY